LRAEIYKASSKTKKKDFIFDGSRSIYAAIGHRPQIDLVIKKAKD
jgi:hypothetical protein